MNHSFYLILIFCFSSSLIAQNYPARVKNEGGIKIVSNPVFPKEGIYDLVFENPFILGKDVDSDKYTFATPIFTALDSKENIYILDWQSKIFVFDKSGKYLKQFGQKGAGPEDLGNSVYFAVSPDDNIYLNDVTNLRLACLDLNGKYIKSYNYPPFESQLFADNNGNLFTKEKSRNNLKIGTSLTKITSPITIKRYDKNFKQTGSFGPYSGEILLMKRDERGSYAQGPYNIFIWGVAPKGFIVYAFGDKYELFKVNPQGKTELKFQREFRYSVNKEYDEKIHSSQYNPAIAHYSFFDNNNNFWVCNYFEKDPEFYVYDVFSEDGIYLKQVYSKYRISIVKNSFALAFDKSKEGLIRFAGGKFLLKKRQN